MTGLLSYAVVDECGSVRFISMFPMIALGAIYKQLNIVLDHETAIRQLHALTIKGELSLKQPDKEPIRLVRRTIDKWE